MAPRLADWPASGCCGPFFPRANSKIRKGRSDGAAPLEDTPIEIYLDNSLLTELKLQPRTTIGDVIGGLRDRMSRSGRLVIGIRADGRDVPQNELDEVLRAGAETYRRLDLSSVDARSTVIETLRQAAAACVECDQARPIIADLLNEGRTQDAMEHLGECLAAWSSTADAMTKSANLFAIDLTEICVDRGPLPNWLESVVGQLRLLRDALENGDLVLTADILRYEMDETLSGWDQAVRAVMNRIEQLTPVAVSAA